MCRCHPKKLSCEIEQNENHLAILFACYTTYPPGYCAKCIMWDVITQEQVMVGSVRVVHRRPLISHVQLQNLNFWSHRSFVFLDHRYVLFGAIRNDPNQYVGCRRQPYLEIGPSTQSSPMALPILSSTRAP